MTLLEILEEIVKGIVQTEQDIKVVQTDGDVMHGKKIIHFHIKVKKDEFSLLVGKGGSTIKALRIVMSKLAGKQKQIAFVDLDES